MNAAINGVAELLFQFLVAATLVLPVGWPPGMLVAPACARPIRLTLVGSATGAWVIAALVPVSGVPGR